MKINHNCDLVLSDLYYYDIRSCYYQLAKSVYFDLGGIDENDKEARNIALGKKQIDNENFSTFLRDTSEGLVEYYLSDNNIQQDEIIVIQTDGCVLTRMLRESEFEIKPDLQEHITLMIITPDRRKFLHVSDKGVTVRGLPNRYKELDKVFERFKKLNVYNKKILFKQLNQIKEFVIDQDNPELYIITKGDKKLVITKKHGVMEVGKRVSIDVSRIDTQKYFEVYFKEFLDSIFLHFY